MRPARDGAGQAILAARTLAAALSEHADRSQRFPPMKNAGDYARRARRSRQPALYRARCFAHKGPAIQCERTVPMPPMLVGTLREWKLACPKGELALVLPNNRGAVRHLTNIVQRGLQPAMVGAGLIKDGKAKYSGMHSLRHFYAS